MKKPMMNELNDDALDHVSGGTDPVFYYKSCTEFRCFYCGYQRTDPGESSHRCTAMGSDVNHRCDECDHLLNCSHAKPFIEEYYGA